MPKQPYRHLARTAHRIETDAAPEQPHPAADKLPDAELLIKRSHDEHLTGPELARAYGTNARIVYAVLEEAGRSRDELWAPPKKKGAPLRQLPYWDALVRDYKAGDTPLTLAERYQTHQTGVDRNLKAVEGLHVRNKTEAGALRAQQMAEADAVRYRLRTGALEKAARDLGVLPDDLRLALETHGLLLHDLG